MSFSIPAALLGLLLVPLLLWLRRRRRRPIERVWPSLLLWREPAATAEGAQARSDPLLWLECACLVLLSLSAADPFVARAASRGRLVVYVDRGRPMQALRADGRTAAEATEEEIRLVEKEFESSVRIPVKGDLLAIALAPAEGARLLASGAEGVGGPGLLVVGRAAQGHNVGIDALQVRGDRLWFALATDGVPRDVNVRIGGGTRRVRTGEGVEVPFADRIEILEVDNYKADNLVQLSRRPLVARNETGSSLIDAALFAAGLPATGEGTAELIIAAAGGDPVSGLVRGAECLAAPGLFEGLLLEGCVWEGVRVGTGPALLTWREGTLASWSDARTLLLGMPVDREWDAHGTLAVLIERAKRERAHALLRPGEALIGDAVASPAPGFVDTRGVDRPFDGTLPRSDRAPSDPLRLRPWLAGAAALGIALLLRAMVKRA